MKIQWSGSRRFPLFLITGFIALPWMPWPDPRVEPPVSALAENLNTGKQTDLGAGEEGRSSRRRSAFVMK